MTMIDRRAFLKRVGVATGAAVVSASPVVAGAIEPGAVETAPSRPISGEPVVVIVRDAARGEVTVLSGKTEKTYTDRALVRRLVKTAARNYEVTRTAEEGA
jgi:hypothetical protein